MCAGKMGKEQFMTELEFSLINLFMLEVSILWIVMKPPKQIGR